MPQTISFPGGSPIQDERRKRRGRKIRGKKETVFSPLVRTRMEERGRHRDYPEITFGEGWEGEAEEEENNPERGRKIGIRRRFEQKGG